MEMEGSVSKGIKGGSGWVRSFLRRRMAGRTRRRRVPLPKLTPIQVVQRTEGEWKEGRGCDDDARSRNRNRAEWSGASPHE